MLRMRGRLTCCPLDRPHQDNDTNFPVILPRLDADNQPSWYFAGRNARGALRLREAIQAFIGPSYSDFNGRPHELNVDDRRSRIR